MVGFVLVIVACLSSDPGDCEQYRMSNIGGQCDQMTIMTALLPQWSALHPRRDIKKWTCGPIGKVEQDL